ncbi:MAG TPA: AprI/Inh family metalloprotease inhibitor [Beijerinckiaceae bacterium]|nr:AprI/Inh family metalloprotease inhibitor [Beijerinckiaceae bacterium]
MVRPGALTALAVALAGPAAAEVATVAGAWELALEGSHRKCRLVLAAEETYRLESPERQVREAALPPPPPLGVPQPTPVDPATAPPVASLPGIYLVDRYLEREVCRIELGLLPAGERLQARLLEGCRDLGLSAFDPTAWRYAAGRLTLTSRRGHEVTLISERPGQWRRDPEVGATLILRKAP